MLVVCAVAASVALVWACQSELECGPVGESCVRPGIKRSCSGLTWGDQPADEECGEGRRCVENVRSSGEAYAACAIGEADPRCARDEDITFCDENRWVRCHGRYREEVVDCGELACAERESVAHCVLSREPDPSCAADQRYSRHCNGDVVVSCFGPFVGKVDDCASRARFCRDGQCVLRAEPDARCMGRALGDETYCDGDVAVLCSKGWRVDEVDCRAANERCAEIRSGATSTYVRCID